MDEQVYQYISIATSLAFASFFACIAMAVLAAMRGELIPDLRTIMASREAFWLTVGVTVIFVIAELCIGLSIHSKNATSAALIEISYPLFTVAFAALLFRQNHLSLGVIVGGLLIFSGVALVS